MLVRGALRWQSGRQGVVRSDPVTAFVCWRSVGAGPQHRSNNVDNISCMSHARIHVIAAVAIGLCSVYGVHNGCLIHDKVVF